MAVRMQKHAVFSPVTAAMGSPHNMMVVPSGQCRDLLAADRADALLRFPELVQVASSPQVGFHLHTKTVLEVHLPLRVVRIRVGFELGIAFDRHLGGFEQVIRLAFSLGAYDLPMKNPVPVTQRSKILPPYPAMGLLRVASRRPTPQGGEDRRVDLVKGAFAGTVSVILCPASDHRIELYK